MGDPVSALAVIGTTLAVGGSVMSAKGQLAQGEADLKTANFNAKLEEIGGLQKSSLIRRRARRHKASQRVAIAKAGVTVEGSPMDALAASAAESEVDAVNAIKEANLNAIMLRRGGRTAAKNAKYGAGASLLSGFGRAVGIASSFSSPASTPEPAGEV